MSEPNKFPKPPINANINRLKTFCVARNPEKGIIISEGIGILQLSKAINKKIPTYPPFFINPKIKAAINDKILLNIDYFPFKYLTPSSGSTVVISIPVDNSKPAEILIFGIISICQW